jgi:hypothetical protein
MCTFLGRFINSASKEEKEAFKKKAKEIIPHIPKGFTVAVESNRHSVTKYELDTKRKEIGSHFIVDVRRNRHVSG